MPCISAWQVRGGNNVVAGGLQGSGVAVAPAVPVPVPACSCAWPASSRCHHHHPRHQQPTSHCLLVPRCLTMSTETRLRSRCLRLWHASPLT